MFSTHSKGNIFVPLLGELGRAKCLGGGGVFRCLADIVIPLTVTLFRVK